MASLTGNKIKDTYTSLLKVGDNGAIDGSAQALTDGAGNALGLTLTNTGIIVSTNKGTLIGTSSTGEVSSTMIADNAVTATQFNISGNGTSGQLLQSDGDGSFSYVAASSGDITGVTAGDGISGGGTSGTVTITLASTSAGPGLTYASGVLTVDVDDSTIEIDTDTVRVKDLGITTAKLANDAVSYEKVDDEFTTVDALSAGATVAVDFDAAQVFTLTPNASTTFNVTNPKIGITKTIIVTGAGGSYTSDTWQVGGGAGTFNKIAGTYDDTSSTKNFYQITCISATEFWYSISQIAS